MSKNKKKLFLPIPNTSAHTKNQLSRSNGKSARPCTDRHADVSKNRKRGITQLKNLKNTKKNL